MIFKVYFFKLFVLLMYCSPEFVKLSFFVFLAHRVSLKQLFWIFLSGKLQISISLRLFTGKLQCSFCVSYFLDFYVPWNLAWLSLHLKKVTSSSLYWLASGEKYLPSATVRDSDAFSDLFNMPAPYVLFPSVGKFLILYVISWSCRARSGAESLPFAIPRMVLNP